MKRRKFFSAVAALSAAAVVPSVATKPARTARFGAIGPTVYGNFVGGQLKVVAIDRDGNVQPLYEVPYSPTGGLGAAKDCSGSATDSNDRRKAALAAAIRRYRVSIR